MGMYACKIPVGQKTSRLAIEPGYEQRNQSPAAAIGLRIVAEIISGGGDYY